MNKISLLIVSAILSAGMALHGADTTPGTAAPDFSLKGADGKNYALSQFKGKYVVLEWTNPECPFVQKHYSSDNMQKLQKEFTEKGVVWLTIDSSATGQPGYLTPDDAKKWGTETGAAWTALLLDPDGTVGHLYGAKNTPTMVIIDPEGKMIYRGAIDSIASPNKDDIQKATNYVKAGLDEAMSGKPVSNPSTKPYGCGVKYQR